MASAKPDVDAIRRLYGLVVELRRRVMVDVRAGEKALLRGCFPIIDAMRDAAREAGYRSPLEWSGVFKPDGWAEWVRIDLHDAQGRCVNSALVDVPANPDHRRTHWCVYAREQPDFREALLTTLVLWRDALRKRICESAAGPTVARVQIPAGSTPGEVFDRTGSVWKPSGRGITHDLCHEIDAALQAYGSKLMRPAPAHGEDGDTDQALWSANRILRMLIEDWATAAAGKPGLTLTDVERMRAKLLDWHADWFHCWHGTHYRCERCERYATTYTGLEPIATGRELVNEVMRIRGFVEPKEDARPADTPNKDGYVEAPADPTAYVSAADILAKHTPPEVLITRKELPKLLRDFAKNGVRWTRPPGRNEKPRRNRLLVHLADWTQYVERRKGKADSWPSVSESERVATANAIRRQRATGK